MLLSLLILSPLTVAVAAADPVLLPDVVRLVAPAVVLAPVVPAVAVAKSLVSPFPFFLPDDVSDTFDLVHDVYVSFVAQARIPLSSVVVAVAPVPSVRSHSDEVP